ncbi:MAG: redoxin domain-containing protein [Chitinophagaceae bacterium]|nr:redoxin domain-containing protein [Chitinophagaceae bacterium]
MLEKGNKAPDFTLFNSGKEKVSLADYRGKNILLLFFPLAFTIVCTKELCSIRDNISTYNTFNAQVIGISVDSLYTLARFKEDQHLNFPLLSDFNKSVSEMYETLYQDFSYEMKGVSKRSAFLIDKKGILQYVTILENASEMPDFNAIQSELHRLKDD